MNYKLIKLIVKNLTKSQNTKFLNFVNIVALVSVMLGCIALILSLSILNGFDYKLKETAKKFTSDIAIYTLNKEHIYYANVAKQIAAKIEGIKNIVPVIYTEGLVATKEYTEGVVMQTLSATGNDHNLEKNIIYGEYKFNSENAKEIAIGEALSQKLNVKVGDKLLLYALKNTENITFSSAAYSQFTIKFIYRTGMLQYDETVVFFPYKTLTSFLELPENTASYFEVFVNNIDSVNSIAIKLEDALGYPFIPLTYYDLNRSIFAWIELQKEPIPLILGIISLVAILNIVTMLIVTVVEKTHSIGILRTLGMDNISLIFTFVFSGLKTAIIGAFLGCLLAVIFCFMQLKFNIITLDAKVYFLDSLPIRMENEYFLIVITVVLFFSFLASLIPALIACRISPLKAIKFN